MVEMKDMVAGILVTFLIFIAFGATFVAMSKSEAEGGYDVPVSDSFKQAYMNATDTTSLVGEVTTITYNMSDTLNEAKAKSFDDYFDITQQMKNLALFPFIAFNLVKGVFIYSAGVLHIPPVFLLIGLTFLLFMVVVIGAKILKIEI